MSAFSHRFAPGHTPKILKILIAISVFLTLFSALTTPLFMHVFNMTGPQSWFMLSWWGIKNFLLWQPITYMFVQDVGVVGIQFFTLITLFFNMYILWILGSTLIDYINEKKFLWLYLGTGVLAGLTALLGMRLFGHYAPIGTPSAALLALFTVWTMMHADSQLFLFFLFPLKARWLLESLLIAILVVGLSQWDWVSILLYLSGAFYGYLFGVIFLNLSGPFAFTRNFDRILRNWTRRRGGTTQSKVYNLKGEIELDDDAFMDQMLTKISKSGESSLTFAEKKRMDSIAKKSTRS